MSNQLSALLSAWQQNCTDTEWVLGTVYKTEGSSYRKAGAMMLINGLGQQFGLLSGGCLEADIMRNARKVMFSGQALSVVYDGTDEDDLSFRLGIGCGGKVYIMLQPISAANDLGLHDLATALQNRQTGIYYQQIGGEQAYFTANAPRVLRGSIIEDGWLLSPIKPEPHLLVVGGGIDARPLVSMGKELGWQISLADPRPANARQEFFPKADRILRAWDTELAEQVRQIKADAAILMSHSLELDAQALAFLQHTGLQHISLLGPRHRYLNVLKRAGLSEASLSCPVSGPAGFDIGGQLPESIALSMLAELHAVFYQKAQQPQQQLVAV